MPPACQSVHLSAMFIPGCEEKFTRSLSGILRRDQLKAAACISLSIAKRKLNVTYWKYAVFFSGKKSVLEQYSGNAVNLPVQTSFIFRLQHLSLALTQQFPAQATLFAPIRC